MSSGKEYTVVYYTQYLVLLSISNMNVNCIIQVKIQNSSQRFKQLNESKTITIQIMVHKQVIARMKVSNIDITKCYRGQAHRRTPCIARRATITRLKVYHTPSIFFPPKQVYVTT